MPEPAHQTRDNCQGLEPLVDEIRRRIEDNERFLKGLLEEDPGEDGEGSEQPKEGEEDEDFEEL